MITKQCKQCGKKVIYSTPSHLKAGSATGLCRSCYLDNLRGKVCENSQSWKGGSYIEPIKGYRMIRSLGHHRVRKNGYVLEHILVMEKHLGRHLKFGEQIHHINKNPSDNRIKNLKLIKGQLEHMSYHPQNKTYCSICGKRAIARKLCKKHYWTHFLKEHRSQKRLSG